MPQDETTQAYDVLGYGGVLDLHDGTRWHELTKSHLMQGMQQWIDSQTFKPGDAFDIGNIDAGDADSIVQYAIFGELKYG